MREIKMFIMSNNDKPVKIVFEDFPSETRTEKYHKSLKEVLYDLLWDWNIRRNLTKQQIHTERGKIRRGYYGQSTNFFVKRGIAKEFIESEIEQERERTIITMRHNINSSCLSSDFKFGILNLSK